MSGMYCRVPRVPLKGSKYHRVPRVPLKGSKYYRVPRVPLKGSVRVTIRDTTKVLE